MQYILSPEIQVLNGYTTKSILTVGVQEGKISGTNTNCGSGVIVG